MPDPGNNQPQQDRSEAAGLVPDHEMIRKIDGGAYGEVWLARSVVGTMRAVKVVWRRGFNHDRPYEREFEGIQKFEPVSREHSGLVHVLHVGRNDAKGCFYYVMELADDATTDEPIAPGHFAVENYRPKTLREVQRRRGRLPMSECLEIGERLGSALACLHRAGLVHRDIKPSNIIFVAGQPKLADIGLVAGIEENVSFVGTEGFVPQEGPGKPTADIYSLGKVLYELGTGLDRKEFPKLPVGGGAADDERESFAEFNEVLVRACDPVAAQRYQSADDLRDELLLLKGGKSVRRLRGIERRFALARKLSVGAAIAAAVAIAAYFGSFKQIRRALQAERSALANVELLQLQKAGDLLKQDDSSTALAILAHVVRQNPTNRVAVERLLSALTWRGFMVPRLEPVIPKGRPSFAVFSPDNTEFLTGTHDGYLQTWNASTGEHLRSIRLTPGRIFSANYSRDGRIVGVGHFTAVAFLERATLQPIFDPIDLGVRVSFVDFSPDMQWMATASSDHFARFWDLRTGANHGQPMRHDVTSVRWAKFSPDGSKLITGARDGSVRIWEVPSGRPITPVLSHTGLVTSVAFSPDGKLAASASDDFEARLWHADTGRLHAVLRHQYCVSSVAFSPDGTKVVTASEDGSAVIWEVKGGTPLGSPLRHRSWVRYAEFAPDGQRVVTASEDNTARLWDAETTLPISEPLRHPGELAMARFDPRGQAIVSTVSSTISGEVWLWNSTTEEAHGLPLLTDSAASRAWFSPGGEVLAAACRDGTLRSWRVNRGFESLPALHAGSPIGRGVFSPDGRLVALVSGTNATIWDFTSRRMTAGPLNHYEAINSVRFSPDGSRLITASGDGTACLWNTMTGAHLLELPPASLRPANVKVLRGNDIIYAEFSPDGSQVLTASKELNASVWNAVSGELVAAFKHEHAVVHAEFSPDGKQVLTASIDRTARLWNVETGHQVGQPLVHDSDLLTARFSQDGRRVVTASMDWTARVWNADTGLLVCDPLRHQSPVREVRFSPDGLTVAAGGDDGLVRLWDPATGLALNDGFRHKSPIVSIQFSPDGNWLVVVPRDGDIEVYDLLRPSLPAPAWLADFAEAVGGQRFGPSGKIELASPKRFFQLRQQLNSSTGSDFYASWAAWFLAETDHRTISPRMTVTLQEYVSRKIARNTIPGLREAIFLSPTNALAHARLARLLIDDTATSGTRRLQQAQWHSTYAHKLAPNDQEVLRIRSEILARLNAIQTTSLPAIR